MEIIMVRVTSNGEIDDSSSRNEEIDSKGDGHVDGVLIDGDHE
jgi:hypothetical protein